jgi:hypothetical protein
MLVNMLLVGGSIAVMYLVTWYSFGAEGLLTASNEDETLRRAPGKAIARILFMVGLIAVIYWTAELHWYVRALFSFAYNIIGYVVVMTYAVHKNYC